MSEHIVFCGKCGASIDESTSLAVGRRDPCGVCGSILRSFGWQLTTPAFPPARRERHEADGRLAEVFVDRNLATGLKDYLTKFWPLNRVPDAFTGFRESGPDLVRSHFGADGPTARP
jgi:hypothetical protein